MTFDGTCERGGGSNEHPRELRRAPLNTGGRRAPCAVDPLSVVRCALCVVVVAGCGRWAMGGPPSIPPSAIRHRPR
jgi:hypothetical protein